MNITRAKELIEWVEAHWDQFDMNEWQERKAGVGVVFKEADHSCLTAGCLSGWSVYLWGQGLVSDESRDWELWVDREEDGTVASLNWEIAGAKILGLTVREAQYLFWPSSYEDVLGKALVGRIGNFVGPELETSDREALNRAAIARLKEMIAEEEQVQKLEAAMNEERVP